MKIRNSIIILPLYLSIHYSYGQFESQIPQAIKYDPSDVVDSTYGIAMYKKLNFWLGGDSVRNDKKGYPCRGWITDYYKSGTILHKGYYIDGQLKNFKNYYETGQLERSYDSPDMDVKSLLRTYYKNGNLKSQIEYVQRQPVRVTLYYADSKIKSEVNYVNRNPVSVKDYYPNGVIQSEMEYDQDFRIIYTYNYFDNGNTESVIKLKDQSTGTYSKKFFASTGSLREQGEVIFNPQLRDFQKTGMWLVYDPSGNPAFAEIYSEGKRTSKTVITK